MGLNQDSVYVAFEDLDASSHQAGSLSHFFPCAGHIKLEFQKVADKFSSLLREGHERLGCSFAAYYKGQLVVHLWGGWINEEKDKKWDEHTRTVLFSCTKSVSTIVLHYVLDRANVSVNRKVSDFWPEYGRHGKEETTILQVLHHQAGIPFTDSGPLAQNDMMNPERMSRYFEEAIPIWKPGTHTGYHALTYGFLLDQISRRIDPQRRGIAEIFHADIIGQYDIKDISIGLSKDELPHPTVATVYNPNEDDLKKAEIKNPLAHKRYFLSYNDYNKRLYKQWSFIKIDDYNLKENQCLQMPSNMGIGSAKGLAEVHSLVATRKLLNHKFYDIVMGPVLVNEMDTINQYEENKGFGWQWTQNPWGEWIFGHSGHGGQNVKIDCHHQLAFAFVCNGLHVADADLVFTFSQLQAELYECVKLLETTNGS